MNLDANKMWNWLWPDVGPTPVSFGLDAEIFDTEQFPNAQTFVREAIQNSLDARVTSSKPVEVHFSFHEDRLVERAEFLEDLRSKKECGSLPWPEDWDEGSITWLTVQDFNSTGLLGDTTSRVSDFWNYWLNFGISNKSGAGRGGRGIGRVTFLIASRINTVIGLTQRESDGEILACGMSVLKPVEIGGELKTSYAYLARQAQKNIFQLYGGNEFHERVAAAFRIDAHLEDYSSGLSLVIPYPHADLTPDKLAAAAIENFAPAIANGTLVVKVDGARIDATSIDSTAERVQSLFTSSAMQQDPQRLLNLIRKAIDNPSHSIRVDKPTRFVRQIEDSDRAILRDLAEKTEPFSFVVEVPVLRNGVTSYSPILVALEKTISDHKPIDMFYREGMALPQVVAKNVGDINLVVQANEGELATYLNFCEGKAHLDLLENRDVKEKLREKGFTGGITVKRFVRWLMDDIRMTILPDASEPDSSVMRGFFSIPRKDQSRQLSGSGGHEGGDPNRPKLDPDKPVPPPQPQPFVVTGLNDGFRLSTNANFDGFPIGFRAEVAYATGERRPKWTKHDFDLEQLRITGAKSGLKITGNTIIGASCDESFVLEVTGFDVRRELSVNLVAVEVDDA